MSLVLKKNNNKQEKSRQEVEGRRLLHHRLLKHDFNQGQPSSLIMGQPGGCKTAVSCHICEYFINNHPEDKIFWRSAQNAPAQFVKLPKWHIYIEKHSGIRFYNRKTGEDITEKLKTQRRLTVFDGFEDLYRRAKPGVCNGVFFKDLHLEGIKKDQGTLQWFRFIRFLLNKFDWCQIFFDEYQEMVKANQGERMYFEIDHHSDDVSSARKTHVGIHANIHQTPEVDYRVLPSFMMTLQLYGSRVYKHNLVNKKALAKLPEPNLDDGAFAWIAEGNHYGIINFPKIYELTENNQYAARIIPEYEHIKVCPVCNRTFVYERSDQVYCHRSCQDKAYRQRKKEKEGDDEGLPVLHPHPSPNY